MKIFFEDGYIVLGRHAPVFNFVVDAGHGYSNNERYLDFLQDTVQDCAVYTNSLVALNNKYCWNSDLKVPELYLRNKDNIFTRVDDLTDRELREGHNLLALFRNGAFYGASAQGGMK